MENTKWEVAIMVFGIVLLVVLALNFIAAQRLPTVGADEGNWGSLLNAFLNVTLTENGTLKPNIVNATHIADDAIDTASKIVDNIITGAKIVAGSITATHIAPSIINSTHIADGSITQQDLSASVINATHVTTSAINAAHITDGSITGIDISNTSNITANVLNSSLVVLSLIEVEDECNSALCESTATCPNGTRVIFGFSADNSLLCDTIPLNCNSFCQVGMQSCSITATVASASVKIVCGKVA